MSGVGITFDETHSFRDWGLRLKKIVIGIPKAKTEYVSVPGMNGDLDLSEAQNGGVKYEMRTLKFTFGARNCSYERWSGLLSQIASDLQGISKRIILDTDKGYYYTGRCEIETEKNNDVTAEIVISCKCEPYKISVDSSDEPWKIENAVARAEAIALDDSHGYDQVDRWGKPNYDCSGLVIRCLEEAGIPAKSSGATYTGNMPEVLPKIGFKDVVKSVDLATGSGMIRGDVLLGNGHTAFYCGNGKLVHASINEKGTVTGGKSGDQTGREICIRSYYNKPWIHVYRYTGVTASASGTVNVRNYLQKGDSGDAVKEMQKMLIGCGFSCGNSGVDGSFGGDTEKALFAFQAFYGLEQDGKYGPASKAKLVSVYNGKTAASVPEKKSTPSYTAGHEYTLQVELKVRTGPGTNYSAKKHSQLTADGQKHDKDNDGCLDAGTVVTCQEVRNVGNDIWMKAPSGWMAAYYDGKVYIK